MERRRRRMPPAVIQRWEKLGHLSSSQTQQLLQLGRTHDEVERVETRLEKLAGRLKDAIHDQRRARENLVSLGEGRESRTLRQRYLRALEDGEERILRLRADQVTLQQERDLALTQVSRRIREASVK